MSDLSTTLMEPLLIPVDQADKYGLHDKATELVQQSTSLSASLRPETAESLAAILRAMNCYYSNLIEGHNTLPVDIERALQGAYASAPEKRDLQLEAKAHIEVQAWIDDDGLQDPVASVDNIVEIHRRFCQELPPELLVAENPETGARVQVEPGVFRSQDVIVGRHVPVAANAIPAYLDRFQSVYGTSQVMASTMAAAAMHHRLLWIHPFLDGNGRVARLLTHALLRKALQTHSLWSISRGLARTESQYKKHLAACDEPRRNATDGRGSLSQRALIDFTEYFLDVCLDQVAFMRRLIEPEQLQRRILYWAGLQIADRQLHKGADRVLEAILFKGELPRGEVPTILNASDRTASRVVASLEQAGAIQAQSSRAPLRLLFTTRLSEFWLPGLFG